MRAFVTLLLLLVTNFGATVMADPKVDILDPETLKSLDQAGAFSLGTVLGIPEAQSLKQFHQSGNSMYATIESTITRDVEELIAKSGEKLAFSSEQAEKLAAAGNTGRHFDPYWLSSKDARFALIAVVNRIDKRDFYPGTCGEIRFIYRLVYKRDVSHSTLPVFLNVVFDYKSDNSGRCSSLAAGWEKADGATALNKNNFDLKQIELNMQILRFPSGQKIDFGGQAVYMFRIFSTANGKFVSIPLENTPDVQAITKSPELRASLLKQIGSNLEKIDNGVFVLDNTNGQLLATRALSFSTSGRARLSNKPFTAIFGAEAADLKSFNLSGLKYVRSSKGLVERLNNSTCIGCHQMGGTAGFHMLGMTGALNSAFNQVILPFSPHYSAERVHRVKYLSSLVAGQDPMTFRPLSIHPAGATAQDRDLCLPDNKDFAAGFSCEAESECKVTVANKSIGVAIGECVLKRNTVSGHICRKGTIETAPLTNVSDLFNLFAFRDKIDIDHVITSSEFACGNPKGGVPLGRISKGCDSNTAAGRLEFVDTLNSGSNPPREFCAIRGGPQFDECAKTSNPPECLARAPIARGMLDSCYLGHFCREDYICQQLPTAVSRLYSGNEKNVVEKRIAKLGEFGIGFCVPNYFVFNMRSDGHIIPEGRNAR